MKLARALVYWAAGSRAKQESLGQLERLPEAPRAELLRAEAPRTKWLCDEWQRATEYSLQRVRQLWLLQAVHPRTFGIGPV